jgi:hypothetical protein
LRCPQPRARQPARVEDWARDLRVRIAIRGGTAIQDCLVQRTGMAERSMPAPKAYDFLAAQRNSRALADLAQRQFEREGIAGSPSEKRRDAHRPSLCNRSSRGRT